jgi:RNA polymerase sigma-70 factor, ECF subfamily
MDSFAASLLPHVPRLRAIARLRGADPDDLVQETLARALRFRSHFRNGSDVGAWLVRILFNLDAGERRRRHRFARASARLMHEPAPLRGDPSATVELERLSGRLAADDLLLITRAELYGDTYAELARDLEVPIGTIMSRLFRARRRVLRYVGAPPQAQRSRDGSRSTLSAPAGTPSSRIMPRSSSTRMATSPSGSPMRAASGRGLCVASSATRRSK